MFVKKKKNKKNSKQVVDAWMKSRARKLGGQPTSSVSCLLLEVDVQRGNFSLTVSSYNGSNTAERRPKRLEVVVETTTQRRLGVSPSTLASKEYNASLAPPYCPDASGRVNTKNVLEPSFQF